MNSPIWMPPSQGLFSIRSAWEQIRDTSQPLPWASTVRFKGRYPRHSITVWKAMLNRLSTKDRICRINSAIDAKCCLCNAVPESVDHLFFKCGFTSWIWKAILWRALIEHEM
ncbi:uncharacterized protein LOC143857022 [Tasmannia lanceolata]|uniref:uncharacterized protein LOC143857022 n=1 Tax=Tasmannia lanceolata TaxID=3420 RepID=UPI00406449C5